MKKLQMIKTKIIAAALVFALVLSSVAMVAPTVNVSADCILRRLVASDAMINGHPAIVNGHLLGGAL